ncbi:hypothetical protein AVEN_114070-1 [Araneus ventricosus]|uniref:Transposable element Tc1 transposase n=1 Tax=Araneus ventricosus TaxID=182803 RepID=A0A4Y2QKB5_ARAVE|nr:hypothetical protein AVEN_114070-1 [Araneus ventricosus]
MKRQHYLKVLNDQVIPSVDCSFLMELAYPRTVELWGNVMWSDESRFCLFQNDGHTMVRRETHEAMGLLCIVPTVQANGSSIMIWGCFNGYDLGSATIFDNRIDCRIT